MTLLGRIAWRQQSTPSLYPGRSAPWSCAGALLGAAIKRSDRFGSPRANFSTCGLKAMSLFTRGRRFAPVERLATCRTASNGPRSRRYFPRLSSTAYHRLEAQGSRVDKTSTRTSAAPGSQHETICRNFDCHLRLRIAIGLAGKGLHKGSLDRRHRWPYHRAPRPHGSGFRLYHRAP